MPAGLTSFENNDRFFVKFFLLDGSLNMNQWGVTEDALRRNLDSFIGKPFVVTPKLTHPDSELGINVSGDELMRIQEQFRAGDIIEVGIDGQQENIKAWGVAEIKDESAIDAIKQGQIKFVSPSLVFGPMDMTRSGFSEVINNFEGAHVAGVKEPAFGMLKAQIKGQCAGSEGICMNQLQSVQASLKRSSCGKKMVYRQGSKILVFKASQCMEDCLGKKKDKGIAIDDQAVAICLSECGESKEADCGEPPLEPCKDPTPKSMEGDISKESLENITERQLLKKKKKAILKKDVKPYKANTSSKSVKSKSKSMTAQEEEKKDEDANIEEEDEEKKQGKNRKAKSKRGQDEDKKKEEGQEEDEDKDAEDEEEEEAEEEEKKKEEASIKRQLSALRKELKSFSNKPVAADIANAKVTLGLIKEADKDSEIANLVKMPVKDLNKLQAEYTKLAETRQANTVNLPFTVRQASLQDDRSDSIKLAGGVISMLERRL